MRNPICHSRSNRESMHNNYLWILDFSRMTLVSSHSLQLASFVRAIIFLLFAIILLFSAPSIFAQEVNPPPSAKQLGISFPIAELGNCNSITECKTYCEDETNKDACISFAKKKGFHRERRAEEENGDRESKLVEIAKGELGCNSKDECMALCQKEENFEKCSNFAKAHGLGEGSKHKDRKILEKAKEILGCESPESCKAVCDNPENKEKCSKFAKETGLGGGTRRVGPGGCNSEESCKKFCEGNPEECAKFGGGPNERSAQNIEGPGGCEGPDQCKKYCEEHPDECKNFGQVVKDERREEFCRDNPEKCVGNSGRGSFNSGPGNREDFCRQNPDKCKPPAESFRKPGDDVSPEGQQRFEDRRQDFEQQSENSGPSGSFEESRSGSSGESQSTSGTSGGESSGETKTEEVRGISTEKGFFQRILSILGL